MIKWKFAFNKYFKSNTFRNYKKGTKMKILLATDGSAYSKSAVEETAKRLFPPKTEVRIISVYERSPLILTTRLSMGGDADYYAELDAAAHKSAEDAVQKASNILERKNSAFSISTAVISGSPKEVIIKEAEKFNADLIVVGSQGKGAMARFMLGSVSQAVALHAPCSVEIVRKQKKAENA